MDYLPAPAKRRRAERRTGGGQDTSPGDWMGVLGTGHVYCVLVQDGHVSHYAQFFNGRCPAQPFVHDNGPIPTLLSPMYRTPLLQTLDANANSTYPQFTQ